ncbi:S-adenosylmethionine-dependent methyltransferase domain protein [Leptospira ryugenii]|uniref:S-adenosylmethionine-dependent methyltransferase domain protein n=1 Tax=Leptospira ryugenii TaxID=1917863 RepID=A0A2P2DX49_9LEPT|nr:class I SAM-dependent rRNA methyltransferase [Leptospira ryugenii]GBF49207.1 S-adenosylmethionine-dependent methyltransferase domain protein [Leptospira ryugenii]
MYVKLKPGKEKSVLSRHPWIFSGAIQEAEINPKSSAPVEIQNAKGERLAFGDWDGGSQIRVRVFHWTDKETNFDESFWHKRWADIWNRKVSTFLSKDTNAFRFLFSESDLSPGMIVDCYDKTAVILCTTPKARERKEILCTFLKKQGVELIIEKPAKDHLVKEKTNILYGKQKDVYFYESGIQYFLDWEEGQKTGFFLDQKENRDLVKQYAKGKSVLNAFSYSGGFSLASLVGGAVRVDSLDISERAIQILEKNLHSNALVPSKANHRSIQQDAFVFLKNMESDLYDLMILDPPAFSKSVDSIQKASRGYKEINRQALLKIKKNGFLFTFSCSQHISRDLFQKIIFAAAKDAGREARVLKVLSQSPDHGFSIFHPEGEYLKGFLIQVDERG